jgi:beta-N-acetylhexosaminidase
VAMVRQTDLGRIPIIALCLLICMAVWPSRVGANENAPLVLAQNSVPASTVPLERMIGQMLMVGFFGTAQSDPGVQTVVAQVQAGKIGGILYLRDNVVSLAAVAQMNKAFLSAGRGLTPFIAVDQEGGFIQRLKRDIGFPETLSAKRMAAQGLGRAWQDYSTMARALHDHGFNLNLGPVVDLESNPDNPIIARYRRAYSADPDEVASFAAMFIQAHQAVGVLTALKHFPGHGSSQSDTHLGFTDITASWNERELEPYRQLLGRRDLRVDMVMAGHLYHSGLNAGGEPRTPATLSPQVMSRLRGRAPAGLGYQGVVITDDLRMGAIREHFDDTEALIAAVRAGNDILMYSALGNDMAGLPDRVIETLRAEAARDPAFARRIEQSYTRIMALKAWLGQGTAASSTPRPAVAQPVARPLPEAAPQRTTPAAEAQQAAPAPAQVRRLPEPVFDPVGD